MVQALFAIAAARIVPPVFVRHADKAGLFLPDFIWQRVTRPMSPHAIHSTDIIDSLAAICGADNVLVDMESRALFAQDVYGQGKTPLAVVRPPTREAAAKAVAAAARAGVAIFPRGGGMSYTDAFLPTVEAAIMVDTGALDRIVNIDPRALHATVESGCTWAKLDDELAVHGLRARFWGPFSGHDATVGGSLSNGTATFGSGISGTSGDNILSVEVALADGRVIHTGMDAQLGHDPFFSQYGPNLTGLFANDAGALGLKLSITLPLQPRAGHVEGVSAIFPDFDRMAAAMEAVARQGLASEIFAMDPVVTAQFAGEPDLRTDLKMLLEIGKGPGGLKRMFRTVTGGRAFLKTPGFHAHFVVEGRDRLDALAKAAVVRHHLVGAREIPNSVPSAVRAVPFSPLPVTDPRGRRVLPIHGILPYAQAASLHAAVMAIVARHADEAEAASLVVGTSFFGIGNNAFLYEPVFYWPDALSEYQARKTVSEMRYPANDLARALVERMREQMVAAMFDHGAAHLQIGKKYPYLQDREASLLRSIKAAIDPNNLMNPGALGL
ncbi:MAG: FAD-binding oxidoreductase [Sphingomonadaceae bacterium]|nr:FAD-binding oxidoreductase [Sphingomonadaceae bacterium]